MRKTIAEELEERRENNPAPFAKFASWTIPAKWIALGLGVFGSLGASGGHIGVFLVVALLNPILWLAVWFHCLSRQIGCPHCGGKSPISDEVGYAEIGKILECPLCKNTYKKPAM